MSPVALLCAIIAQSDRVAATTYRDCDANGQLVTAGLVRRQGLVQSVHAAPEANGSQVQLLYPRTIIRVTKGAAQPGGNPTSGGEH